MNLVPISIVCPECGSADVIYSCKPECCFNHVCNQCYTTFELESERVGEVSEIFTPPPEPDSTHPTIPCARCGECQVFLWEGAPQAFPAYVCISCKAVLKASFTNIAKG